MEGVLDDILSEFLGFYTKNLFSWENIHYQIVIKIIICRKFIKIEYESSWNLIDEQYRSYNNFIRIFIFFIT